MEKFRRVKEFGEWAGADVDELGIWSGTELESFHVGEVGLGRTYRSRVSRLLPLPPGAGMDRADVR